MGYLHIYDTDNPISTLTRLNVRPTLHILYDRYSTIALRTKLCLHNLVSCGQLFTYT